MKRICRLGEHYIYTDGNVYTESGTFIGNEHAVKVAYLKGFSILPVESKNKYTITFSEKNNAYVVIDSEMYEHYDSQYSYFMIGTSINKHSNGYIPDNKEAFKQYVLSSLCFYDDYVGSNSWACDDILYRVSDCIRYDVVGVLVAYFSQVDNKVVEKFYPLPAEYGNGEWTAKTMEDAYKMALDYANFVAL